MIRILLLVDCANDFDRNLLRGIVRYSRENGPWLFYRLPSYYRSIENGERSILEWAKAWKADAIIGQWNDDAMDLLKELNIPVVLQNYRHRSTTYSNLTGDYEGTGLMAARFFAERLFRNFAFFGAKGVRWSDERCKGYRGEVERIGGTFHAFETGNDRCWAAGCANCPNPWHCSAATMPMHSLSRRYAKWRTSPFRRMSRCWAWTTTS